MTAPRPKTLPLAGAALALLLLALAGTAQAATLTAPGASAMPTTVRIDPPSPYYYEGYLTWSGGQGGVAWDPKAPTDHPGVPTQTAQSRVSGWVGWNLRSSAQNPQDMIPSDVFTSAPMPSALYLNVSRLITLNLFMTPKCVGHDIELYADNVFLAGFQHRAAPTIPNRFVPGTGFCEEKFRMHAELAVIPKGAVLKVKVLHFDREDGFGYGLQGDQRSVLRLPTYSPEDLVLRVKEFADASSKGAGSSESQAEDASPAAAIASLFAVGALVAIPAGTRPGRRALIGLLIVSMAFGGCLGSTSTTDETASNNANPTGKSTVTIIRDDDNLTGLSNEQTGSIVGFVIDDLGIPVEGAHVALIGGLLTDKTDRYGKFTFAGLKPKIYTVRVDKENLLSVEAEVKVVAKSITRVEIEMVPTDPSVRDTRPHKHDYWPESGVKEAMSENVVFHEDSFFCGSPGTQDASAGATTPNRYCTTPFHLPVVDRYSTVLPGTANMKVEVTWSTTSNRVDRVGIGFVDNADTNITLMYPKANGVPTNIRTGWEMTDVGHQEFSTWNFFLYVPTNEGGFPPRQSTQTISGPFLVKVTLEKGTIPLEPGHGDFWAGNNTYTVFSNAANTAGGTRGTSYDATWIPQKRFVPPDTQWLDITLTRSGEPTLPAEWQLLYRPANVPTWLEGYKMPKADVVAKNGLVWQLRIIVQAGEPDPYYAKKTNWEFRLDDGDDNPRHSLTAITFTLNMVAHRDPLP